MALRLLSSVLGASVSVSAGAGAGAGAGASVNRPTISTTRTPAVGQTTVLTTIATASSAVVLHATNATAGPSVGGVPINGLLPTSGAPNLPIFSSSVTPAAATPLLPLATVSGLPISIGLPLLVENIVPASINSSVFGQYFNALRSAWSAELIPVNNTGNDSYPQFDLTGAPVLAVGQPFSLLTSLPVPGQAISLPNVPTANSSYGNSSTNYLIPENAFITSKWDFYKQDPGELKFVSAADQVKTLEGSLFDTKSSASKHVFNPAPSLSDSKRAIVACLNTTAFVSDGSNKLLAPPRICFGGLINSWSSVFGDISDGVVRNYPGTKGLFKINLDISEPTAGQPINLLVSPVDQTAKLLSPKVDHIVDATPDFKITAALDLGGPLNAFIGAGVKAITGLFHAGAADKVASSVVSVASVLDSLLAIPIALDIKGRSLTKTFKPTTDQLANVVEMAGGLAGTLPIGSLAGLVTSAVSDINVVLPPDVNCITQTLDALHGMSLNFLPDLVSAGSGQSARKINVGVKVRPLLQLPGLDLINEIDLGSVSITLPRVTLPQIAFIFHDFQYTSVNGNQDILVLIDPTTYSLVSQVDQLRTMLSQLTLLLSDIQRIFYQLLGGSNGLQYTQIDSYLNTAATMLTLVTTAPAKGTGTGWINIQNANVPGKGLLDLGAFNFKINDASGVSSLLWIGIPGGVWRFTIGLNGGHAFYFAKPGGSAWSAAVYTYSEGSDNICYQAQLDLNENSCASVWNKGSNQFGDNAVSLQWSRI